MLCDLLIAGIETTPGLQCYSPFSLAYRVWTVSCYGCSSWFNKTVAWPFSLLRTRLGAVRQPSHISESAIVLLALKCVGLGGLEVQLLLCTTLSLTDKQTDFFFFLTKALANKIKKKNTQTKGFPFHPFFSLCFFLCSSSLMGWMNVALRSW